MTLRLRNRSCLGQKIENGFEQKLAKDAKESHAKEGQMERFDSTDAFSCFGFLSDLCDLRDLLFNQSVMVSPAF